MSASSPEESVPLRRKRHKRRSKWVRARSNAGRLRSEKDRLIAAVDSSRQQLASQQRRLAEAQRGIQVAQVAIDEAQVTRDAIRAEIAMLGSEIEGLVEMKGRIVAILRALRNEIDTTETRYGNGLSSEDDQAIRQPPNGHPSLPLRNEPQSSRIVNLDKSAFTDLASVSKLQHDLRTLQHVEDVFVRRVERGRILVELAFQNHRVAQATNCNPLDHDNDLESVE